MPVNYQYIKYKVLLRNKNTKNEVVYRSFCKIGFWRKSIKAQNPKEKAGSRPAGRLPEGFSLEPDLSFGLTKRAKSASIVSS